MNDDIGASVGLEDDSNFFLWNVVFEGPSDTLYEV
jgi:ubiquitin-conjugating enzyme E2 G1